MLAGILIPSRLALAQAPVPQPTPPTRDPHSPGYVAAIELPDGAVPPPDKDGSFILGPTHAPAPETQPGDDVPKGKVHEFVLTPADSRVYPDGIARDPGTFGTPDPADPAKLVVTTSRPAPWTRTVAVFVPSQYVAGTAAPFIVVADGPNPLLFATLETLIARKRIPVMVGIAVGNGGGDAQGSQRGLEYDTLSARYAEFIEKDVLPQVERRAGVRLTSDPDLRATMGCSSGAAAAFTMAWYRNDLYHRVLSYSGTYVNQQWPSNAETPGGAWEYHASLVPRSPHKPIRIWMHVGDRDLLNPNVMRDGMHDWVEANERMAKALAAKGYAYQFVFARNAGHCDRAVTAQTLPAALEWLWRPARVESGSGAGTPGRGRLPLEAISMASTQQEKALRFQVLHGGPGAFVIPNPWDVGSARLLAGLGFSALATSSAASAAALGRRDGRLSRDEALAHARSIVSATDLPVSADLEAGFGGAPETVAETVRMAAEAGLVGCTIEDATGKADSPLFDFDHAVERIAAAAEAARALPFPFMLTARAHGFLFAAPRLDEVIQRLQAFERAGAEVMFAPGLPDLTTVRTVCSALSKPFNFMVGIKGRSFTVAELEDAGVRRISLATSLFRAAMTSFLAAAREVKDEGRFDYVEGCVTSSELNALMGI